MVFAKILDEIVLILNLFLLDWKTDVRKSNLKAS